MLATWSELEQYDIDRLSRPELSEAIRDHETHLPSDLRERVEEQPLENLRMLLLAARLLHLLRQVWQATGGGASLDGAELDSVDFEIVDGDAEAVLPQEAAADNESV